jgi:quinoprotein glucose dehydrogenase
VLGLWRPLPEREAAAAAAALRTDIASLFSGSEGLRKAAIEIAGRLGLKEIGPELYRLVLDAKEHAGTRVEALHALDALQDAKVAEAVDVALESDQPVLRAMARRVLARTQPQAALELIKDVLDAGEIVEQQAAFATLGSLKDAQAQAILAEWLAKLKSGGVKPELHLELLEAGRQHNTDTLKSLLAEIEAARKPGDAVSQFQESLAGGNAETGRTLFFEKTSLSCVRCHKVGGQGGEVGPDLSSIGLQQKREYLLTSLADSNKDIAKGFETVNIMTVDGLVHTGIVKNDDGTTLTLITAEAKLVAIPKADIEDQARGKSAMPEDLIKKMSRRELRDLVEFLAQQKNPVEK